MALKALRNIIDKKWFKSAYNLNSPSLHHRESLNAVFQPLARFVAEVAVASAALLPPLPQTQLQVLLILPLRTRSRPTEVLEVFGA